MLEFVFLAFIILSGTASQSEDKLQEEESILLKMIFSADRRVPKDKWGTSCTMTKNKKPHPPIHALWTKCPDEVEMVAHMDMEMLMNVKMEKEIQIIRRAQLIHLSPNEITHITRSYFSYSSDNFQNCGQFPERELDPSSSKFMEDIKGKRGIVEEVDFQWAKMQNPTLREIILNYPANESSWFSLLADVKDKDNFKVSIQGGMDLNRGTRFNQVNCTARVKNSPRNVNQLLTDLRIHAEAEYWGCQCIDISRKEWDKKFNGTKPIPNNFTVAVIELCKSQLPQTLSRILPQKEWGDVIHFARISDCVENKKEFRNNLLSILPKHSNEIKTEL